MADSTKRFSERVEDYIKYRPGYPPEIINYLKDQIGLVPEWNVADIGSGTGILSKLFLSNGNIVYGVEPNKEMREAGEAELHEYQKFISINGTAEFTKLKDSSVELVTAGQAFHWFDRVKSKKEFSRILRPDGWAVLIWNNRKKNATLFSKDYEQLLLDFGTDYKSVDHSNITEDILDTFFESFDMKIFPNYQELNYDGLLGRLTSSSYIPGRNHPSFKKITERAKEIFRKSETYGKVRIDYDTEIYYGRII